jgi:hypothetical protein
MANPHMGEVAVEIGGTPYTLVFNVNAICEIEDLLGRTWIDIARELQTWAPKTAANGKPAQETEAETLDRASRVDMRLIRALFWGALREHHDEVTLKQAGALMDGVQGGALDVLNKLFERIGSDSDKGAVSPNPPPPGRKKPPSTGPASSAAGAG